MARPALRVGASCFALASMPWFVAALPAPVVAWTFFAGSVFFTTAAGLQFHEAATAPGVIGTGVSAGAGRVGHWRPRSIDWWSAVVQFGGTIAFNVSTFAATRADVGGVREIRLIWTPDVVGSVCFLVASWLAYAEVNRGAVPRHDRTTGWRIAALNMAGSIAFAVSAIAARYVPATGEPANAALVNLTTFSGACCFLVGALLLPVESARDAVANPTAG